MFAAPDSDPYEHRKEIIASMELPVVAKKPAMALGGTSGDAPSFVRPYPIKILNSPGCIFNISIMLKHFHNVRCFSS